MAEAWKGGTFESGSDTTRVGRWMSQDEYDKMDKKGGADGWGIINGAGYLLDRLYDKKGLPRITEMPKATNITIVGSK